MHNFDRTTTRRVPRTIIAQNWNGNNPVTAVLDVHSELSQHQIIIACQSIPVSLIVKLDVRPINSGMFVNIATLDLSVNGSLQLLCSGIFDAIRLTASQALVGNFIYSQIDSLGEDFIISGPAGKNANDIVYNSFLTTISGVPITTIAGDFISVSV